MIEKLLIENIAVIEKAEINFEKGFNVLTGETGAGKSVIIDSINAVTGERTSRELIRTGSDKATVIAAFTDINDNVNEKLSSLGYPVNDDGTLLISRSLSLSGKSSCKINSMPASAATLREISGELINIHGQNDSQALLNPERHCDYIDSLANNAELKENYRKSFRQLISVKKELDSLYDLRDESIKRLDYLKFSVDEIEKADIKIGEIEELNKEKTLIENSKKVFKALNEAYQAIKGEGAVIDCVNKCSGYIASAAKYYPECATLSERATEIEYQLDSLSGDLRQMMENVDFSEKRAKEINDRLDTIYSLTFKYGGSEEKVLLYYDNAIKEIGTIASSDERIATLEKELYSESEKVKKLCKELTGSRKKFAEIFEKNVTNELKFLDMPQVKFVVSFKKVPLSARGADEIEFLISVNPGQEPKSISKTASGGELARIMLAIKNVLLSHDNVDTLIFDEIDTGVSGSAAGKIAEKLYSLSKCKQVLCVTHLAKIAARADVHFKITKEMTEDKTYTKINKLSLEERAREIARITAGNDVTALQLESAMELIKGKG